MKANATNEMVKYLQLNVMVRARLCANKDFTWNLAINSGIVFSESSLFKYLHNKFIILHILSQSQLFKENTKYLSKIFFF